MDQTRFNHLYQAALDPKRAALIALRDPMQREAQAIELEHEGLTIDTEIMVWGGDPYIVMLLRRTMGPKPYTWVPSLGQPDIQEAPGFNQPGLTPYDPANMPAGAVPVPPLLAPNLDQGQNDSAIIAMYPPWQNPNAPPAPAPVPAGVSSLVGKYQGIDGSGERNWTPAFGANVDNLGDGAPYSDPLGGGQFIFHRRELFGGVYEVWFTQ